MRSLGIPSTRSGPIRYAVHSPVKSRQNSSPADASPAADRHSGARQRRPLPHRRAARRRRRPARLPGVDPAAGRDAARGVEPPARAGARRARPDGATWRARVRVARADGFGLSNGGDRARPRRPLLTTPPRAPGTAASPATFGMRRGRSPGRRRCALLLDGPCASQQTECRRAHGRWADRGTGASAPAYVKRCMNSARRRRTRRGGNGHRSEDAMIRHVREISCLACGRDLGRIEAARGEVRRIPPAPSPSTARRGAQARVRTRLRALRRPGAGRSPGSHL